MSKLRSGLSYGRRGGQRGADAGARLVAPTFGKKRFMTYSAKSVGHFLVESDAERLVGNVLTLAPSVKGFRAQSFTIDLLDGVVLDTAEAIADARAKHRLYSGPKFYTPDFAVDWHCTTRTAVEVKIEGYAGSAEYAAKLRIARPILEAHGYHFSKVIVPCSPVHPLRTNVALLSKAARRPDLALTSDRVSEIESGIGDSKITLARLCQRFAISPNVVPVLLFTGALGADIASQAIDGDLLLEAAHGGLDHLELFKGIEE